MDMKLPSDKEAMFEQQLQYSIALLNDLTELLRKKHIPSVAEVENCSCELKKLCRLNEELKRDLFLPLMVHLDNFLAIRPIVGSCGPDMQKLRNRAEELKAQLWELEFPKAEEQVRPHKILSSIIWRIQASNEVVSPQEYQDLNALVAEKIIESQTAFQIAAKQYIIDKKKCQYAKSKEFSKGASVEQETEEKTAVCSQETVSAVDPKTSEAENTGCPPETAPAEELPTAKAETAEATDSEQEKTVTSYRYEEKNKADASWKNFVSEFKKKPLYQSCISFASHVALFDIAETVEQVCLYYPRFKSKEKELIGEVGNFFNRLFEEGLLGKIIPESIDRPRLKDCWFCFTKRAVESFYELEESIKGACIPAAVRNLTAEKETNGVSGIVHFTPFLQPGKIEDSSFIERACGHFRLCRIMLAHYKPMRGKCINFSPADDIVFCEDRYFIRAAVGKFPIRWYALGAISEIEKDPASLLALLQNNRGLLLIRTREDFSALADVFPQEFQINANIVCVSTQGLMLLQKNSWLGIGEAELVEPTEAKTQIETPEAEPSAVVSNENKDTKKENPVATQEVPQLEETAGDDADETSKTAVETEAEVVAETSETTAAADQPVPEACSVPVLPEDSRTAPKESMPNEPLFSAEENSDEDGLLTAIFDSVSSNSDKSAREYAKTLCEDEQFDPFKEKRKALELIFKLLKKGSPTEYDPNKKKCTSSIGDAMLLCRAFAELEEQPGIYHDLLNKLAYAADSDIVENRMYSYSRISEITESKYGCPEYLRQAILLRALFAPSAKGDYGLKSYAESYLNNSNAWQNLGKVREVFQLLLRLHQPEPNTGYSLKTINTLLGGVSIDSQLEALAKEAEGEMRINASLERNQPDFSKELLGPQSPTGYALEIIRSKNIQERDWALEVIGELEDESGMVDAISNAWRRHKRGSANGWVLNISKNSLKKRIALLKKWYDITSDDVPSDIFKEHRTKLIKAIENAQNDLKAVHDVAKNILHNVLEVMKQRLIGNMNLSKLYFAPVLHSGWIMLDNQYQPLFFDSRYESFNSWRNVLQHLCADTPSLDEVRTNIGDRSSMLFDNLQMLELIKALEKQSFSPEEPDAQDVENARKQISAVVDDHKGQIELAYAYGKIFEADKETMLREIDQLQEENEKNLNFGFMKRLISVIGSRIGKCSQKQKKELSERVASLIKNTPQTQGRKHSLLAEAKRLIVEKENYEVAEEYLNRCEADPDQDIEPNDNFFHQEEYLSEFLSQDSYRSKYNICVETDNSSLVCRRISSFFPAGAANRNNSEELVNNWNSFVRNSGSDKSDAIKALFRSFGFNVKCVSRDKNDACRFSLELWDAKKNLESYPTPFKEFGTASERMDVLLVRQKMDPVQIVSKLKSIYPTQVSFIIWDKTIALPERRQLADEFHKDKEFNKTCIIIDKVLLTYLASKTPEVRFEALLSCALPFTQIHPFTDHTGSVADEMFRGRTKYLNEIRSANTSSFFLYGGRQLGKTAILVRAANMMNKPGEKEYAVFIPIKDCRIEYDFIVAVKEKINISLASNLEFSDIKTMCACFREKFMDGTIKRLTLLIDEADLFLEECSKNNYEHLQALVDLDRDTSLRFKFVFAGLHNVFRASNASSANTPLGQLKGMCVEPFSPYEARQLLQIPLNYLGFSFKNDEKLELILSKSNYYPGILNFFGKMLLIAMAEQYASHYSAERNNPPYGLSQEQLKAVIASQDMNNAINSKLRLTLDLDPKYNLLAHCIAWKMYDDPDQRLKGASVEEIQEAAQVFDMDMISDLQTRDCTNLLMEMSEMKLLQRVANDRFRLRKASFLALFGNNAEQVEKSVREKLEELAQ